MKIKKISKRIISIFLTMVTVVTMLAAVTFTTNAVDWRNVDLIIAGQAHVQGKGWDNEIDKKKQFYNPRKEIGQDENVPLFFGTTGESRRLECIRIGIANEIFDGSCFHVACYANGNWIEKRARQVEVGTTGQAKPIEAIKIGLNGAISYYYDVMYRVHIKGRGWDRWHFGWDDTAGSISEHTCIEALEVKLVPLHHF